MATNFESYMVIDIAGESFTLTGEMIGNDIVVSYHEPFAQAVKLGTIDTIIEEVDNVLKLGGVLSGNWASLRSGIGNVPVLGDVVDAIARANIRITDIGINTKINEYVFGFALDFTQMEIKVAEIQLRAFGFVVKAKKDQ